jgi:hypothetical protein
MKKLALALLVGAIAACGGGGKPTLIDGAIDAVVVCNPVMQTGCNAGEKCTWIVDIDGTATTNDVGHIGCVTAGTTPDGGACNDATAAANGGADTCIAGDLCISRKCKPICDPQLVDGSAAGACKADFSCSIYAGVFESGGDPTAGVCEPGCDPLTQRLKVGNLEACGSADATKPSGTCVPSRGFLSFHCAPSGSIVYDKTDRVAPLSDPVSGNPFGNGCAPGFIPFYFNDASGSMMTMCSGLCAPLKNDMTSPAGSNQGDKTALGKLVADATPVAGHAVCTPTVKGAKDIMSAKGEDCRFAWLPLATRGDPTMPSMSPYNDTLGICFAFEKFVDVMVPGPTPGTTTTVPEKSCAELAPSAPTDPFGDAKSEGCYPLADSKALRKTTNRRVHNYRLANGDGLALRHVFD